MSLAVIPALNKAVGVLGKDPASPGVRGLVPSPGLSVQESQLSKVVTALIERYLDRAQPILNAILLLETVRLAEALNELDAAGIHRDPALPKLTQEDVDGGTVDSLLTPQTIPELVRVANALSAQLPDAAQRLKALAQDCGGPLGGVWKP